MLLLISNYSLEQEC